DGGRTMLWLNDGEGRYTDVTANQMPDELVKFSWELEFVDVNNDFALDILVSCKQCLGSYLFENDGTGSFTDVTKDRLPGWSNNYDFEAIDLNGDDYLDLITINDGPKLREHILMNDGQGGFVDETAKLWPDDQNLGYDDSIVAFFDFESDGDADIVIGSLDGPDRLQINDGDGGLTLMEVRQIFPELTRGTLGIALADLNGDHRLDIVEAQGEVTISEKVYFAGATEPDSAPPVISLVSSESPGKDKPIIVRARVHDNKSPTMPHDWQSIQVNWTADDSSGETPMKWIGEYLWLAELEDAAGDLTYEVCATDAAGNEACKPGT
ncbi:MAG: VCBS repeat-containing protein, partial [Anaerolineaceae bacterium]